MSENDLLEIVSALSDIEKLLVANSLEREAKVINSSAMLLIGLASFYWREVSKMQDSSNQENTIH